MANTYDINKQVRLSGAFTVASIATDPTTVTLKVQNPSLNETTYTYAAGQITKDSTGNYHYDLTLDEAGTWYYRWEGTGAVVTAGEGHLNVRRSEF